MTTLNAPITTRPGTLERNLEALRRFSSLTLGAIRDAKAATDIEFFETEERRAVSGTYAGKSLGSQRRPLSEASRIAETLDPKTAGAVVILGFGLGHHVEAIAQRCRNTSIIIVFEPDVALLRAVLERIDHSDWMDRARIVIATDPDDMATLTASLKSQEGLMALGVRIVEHPPSRARLGDSGARFCESFTRMLAATRTIVVTALMQSEVTCRNILSNARAYVENPGVADLVNRCAGRPAITVAAGPSLARNIELLKTPGLRDRCVIIAAQTVLKPLLEIGVQPHFVTSLDYHEISARFYEGLTPEDVAHTTLVVEPKANPAIVRAYPGPKRLPGEQVLDVLFGPEIAGAHGAIRAGSTVAHLSYYFARLLGCDPVILTGQDLGFTDGLYYANGAAIHRVWSSELNPFRSLEMLEWERIARHRHQLRKIKSSAGGEIYTDEQMATYLNAFERMFLEDATAGRMIIDATEGGAAKMNTTGLSLREAIERFAPPDAPLLPDLSPPPALETANDRWSAALERINKVRRDTVRLARLSRDTESLLQQMIDHHDDQPHVNRLIRKAHKMRDESMALHPAFGLVQRINQMGAFKRVRADRDLLLTDDLSPKEIQRRRIERDQVNVQWIADAADALVGLLDEAAGVGSATKRASASASTRAAGDAGVREAARAVTALIPINFERSSLGVVRDLAQPIAGRNALQWTLARLARSRRLRHVTLLTTDAARTRAILGEPPSELTIDIREITQPDWINPAIAAARRFSRSCWRGGIAGLTCHDEVATIGAIRSALRDTSFRAAMLVNADASLIDPDLCDAVIDRWLEAPDSNRVTFTQAPPGLAPCVVDAAFAKDIAELQSWMFTSVGGLIGYHPLHAFGDPIATRVCAPIEPAVRDTYARLMADDPAGRAVLESFGEAALTASALDIARRWRELETPTFPEHFILELCAGAPPHEAAPSWAPDRGEPWRAMPIDLAKRMLDAIARQRADAVVTLDGTGDPLTHPDIRRILDHARATGIAGIHLRTRCLAEDAAWLLDAPVDVISVDLYANTATVYEQITGVDRFRNALENIDLLNNGRNTSSETIPTPWIVPRLTRCSAALDEIETFYDKWMFLLGAAMIDPLPAGVATDRIRALDVPADVAAAQANSTRVITCDGQERPLSVQS